MAPVSEPGGLRTHPLTGLVQGILWSAAAVVAFFGSILSGDGWGNLGVWISLLIGGVGGLVLGIGVGFASWWFTRYVIDGTELRINSGILTKKSRRIPYERLQSVDIAEPLIARILGLAELRIEMAGGSDSRTSLRFLQLAEARSLRTVLLNQAHGHTEDAPEETDNRDLIAAVPPERILIGTVLTLDFLFAGIGAIALVVAGIWFGQIVAFLGGIIPLATYLVQVIMGHNVAQWGFTLSRNKRGLRIERGLLSRTSQTLPFDRVQGIAIQEPFVWRRLGWQRLRVDVAGYASQTDDRGANANTTLLPIADPPLAAHVIDELMPGVDVSSIVLAFVPERSRLFAPIGWKYRAIGADEKVFVSTTGWLQHTTNIVPHDKTQSVALRQGPLQRWKNVATLEVHSPKGPVDAEGRNLDAMKAREEAFEQLNRARAARAL